MISNTLRTICEQSVDQWQPVNTIQPWIKFITEELGAGRVDETEALILTSDMAWRSRALDHPIRVPELDGNLVEVADYAARLRYDFLFAEMFALPDGRPSDVVNHELVKTFTAFGALGLGLVEAETLLMDALASSSSDRTLAVLLHGVWMGVHLDEQDVLAENIFNQLSFKGANENFWFASCLRRAGRYGEAMGHIREALRQHNGDSQVHQDYMREFELIVSFQKFEQRHSLS